MIKGVHSTIIWTEDLRKLVPFYRDVLGFKEVMSGDEFAVLEGSSGPQLALGLHSEVKGQSRDPNRMMVNLSVEDCQAEYVRLLGQRVNFVREPSIDPNDGIMIATLLDPYGKPSSCSNKRSFTTTARPLPPARPHGPLRAVSSGGPAAACRVRSARLRKASLCAGAARAR